MHDHDRPLSERGLDDAAVMARRFAQRHEPLALMLSSTAQRARTTAGIFASAMGGRPVEDAAALYAASLQSLMAIIAGFPDTARQVMIFGHNPGLSQLVGHLTDGLSIYLIPCATIRINLHVEHWREVVQGIGTQGWIDMPPGTK